MRHTNDVKRSTSTDTATAHCNTVQYTATQCNILQHTVTHCNTVQQTSTQCNTVQHSATQCNTLQDSATQCNILQHSATGTHDMMCATSTDRGDSMWGRGGGRIFWKETCNDMLPWIETCEWVNETQHVRYMHVYLRQLHIWVLKRDVYQHTHMKRDLWMRLDPSDICTYICGSRKYDVWKETCNDILTWKETCKWDVNMTFEKRHVTTYSTRHVTHIRRQI